MEILGKRAFSDTIIGENGANTYGLFSRNRRQYDNS